MMRSILCILTILLTAKTFAKSGSAYAIIYYQQNGKTLIYAPTSKRDRIPTLPGGGIIKGETPKEGLLRECKEEIHLNLDMLEAQGLLSQKSEIKTSLSKRHQLSFYVYEVKDMIEFELRVLNGSMAEDVNEDGTVNTTKNSMITLMGKPRPSELRFTEFDFRDANELIRDFKISGKKRNWFLDPVSLALNEL